MKTPKCFLNVSFLCPTHTVIQTPCLFDRLKHFMLHTICFCLLFLNDRKFVFRKSVCTREFFTEIVQKESDTLSQTSVVLTDQNRTANFWAALHFYSVANYVASIPKWLQMISNDSKWLHLSNSLDTQRLIWSPCRSFRVI